MKTIIIDTGYWIKLFNPEKNIEHHEFIELVSNIIADYQILIPYPTLYELLNSKFSRNHRTNNFIEELNKSRYIKIDDLEYKEKALEKYLLNNQKGVTYDISFVDEVIKEMIDDDNLKTDFIMTFDKALENYALSKNVKSL